jgi:Terminase RNaseH-like domain
VRVQVFNAPILDPTKAEHYNKAQILMDATSVGDPIYQALKGAKLNIAGLKFTNQSKRELIDGFALELEQGNLRLPYHDDFLSELKFYRRDVSAAGTVTLGAAPGEHDDLVTAAALAVHEAKARKPVPLVGPVLVPRQSPWRDQQHGSGY